MKTVSIILPVHGQVPRLLATLKRLCRQAGLLPFRAEVLVVAPPGAKLGARPARSNVPFVELHVIKADPARPAGNPTRRGVLASVGDYVLVLQEGSGVPLPELLKLMPHFERGAHVVVGSGYLGQAAARSHSWHLRLGHALTSFLANQVLQAGIRDMDAGFVCYAGPVARQVFAMAQAAGRGVDLEALALARQLGYTLVEVPVRSRPLHMRAAHRFVSAFRFLLDLLVVRWRTGGRRRRLAEQTT
jgi:hypothetical protein